MDHRRFTADDADDSDSRRSDPRKSVSSAVSAVRLLVLGLFVLALSVAPAAGFDRGSTTDVPAELLDSTGASRVVYNRDFTFDDTPHDVSGHGTLNASIAAGLATTDGSDSSGYSYGLGIAPGARVGSSRI